MWWECDIFFPNCTSHFSPSRILTAVCFLLTSSGDEATKDPELIQKDVLENMAKNFPSAYLDVVQHTDLSTLTSTPLMLRFPLDLIFGSTCKWNVTVTGDAMHPMTPDLDHALMIHHNTSSPFLLSQTLEISYLL